MSKTEITPATETEIAEAHEWNEIIDSVAGKDHLTGLTNRRALERAFRRESERAGRTNRPLTVIFFDVDGLKTCNDKQGHNEGDKVLQSVARIGKRAVRGIDLLARFGGDEFAVLLPECDLLHGLEAAERMRLTIGKQSLTVSFGVAQWDGLQTIEGLMKCADKALYHSKNHKGKNRVSGWDGQKIIEHGAGWLQQ